MRLVVLCTMIMAIALAVFAQPATSAVTGIPFVTTGSAIFTEPLSSTALTIEQYNSSSLLGSHASNLNIFFPLSSTGIANGPTERPCTSSNILPFGQVNLAFPSVSQRTNDQLAYQKSYFFTDTFS